MTDECNRALSLVEQRLSEAGCQVGSDVVLRNDRRGISMFGPDGTGTFQFGLVRGWMDFRPTHRDDKLAVEWSWDGNDECDSVMGRGWAVLEGNRTITGRIFIHQGEDSSFRAEKKTGRRRSSGPVS